MSPPLSLPSVSHLPPELELRIFEMCYFANPTHLPTLLLVCKHVFKWFVQPSLRNLPQFLLSPFDYRLNAIRFFYIHLRLDEDIERVKRWIHTQSPESIHQNVKAILINLPDKQCYPKISSMISACTGVESLGIWLYNSEADLVESESLIHVLLTNLPKVKHLSLGTDKHLVKMIASESSRAIQMDQIVFREGLVSIDWGWNPTLPLEMFPHVSYAIIQLGWPLEVEDTRKVEEWVSRPSSKGLILLVDDVDWERNQLPVPLPEGHILHNKNVVLVNTPDVWKNDWESHIFMDGKDVLSVGKRLLGMHQVEDRVVVLAKPMIGAPVLEI